jgi:hypothetical protein
MACNRDELRERPLALAPQVRRFGSNLTVMPVDPISDGTWIAVSDAGVAIALLNANEGAAHRRRASVSRGRIISSLLHAESVEQAGALAERLPRDQFDPFRLVIAGGEQREPVMFTSSGLGDHVVERPRRELFAHFVGEGEMTAQRQDEFHRHRWADHPALSVNMSRRDARTVSFTTIELTSGHAVLRYFADGPDSQRGTAHNLAIRNMVMT